MIEKRIILVLLAVTLILVMVFLATNLSWRSSVAIMNTDGGQNGAESSYIELVDSLGRVVKVEKYPDKIVAVGPGALRLVAYLNALELVVGVEEVEFSWSPLGRDYAMANAEYLKRLPVIGPGGPRSSPEPERIRSVNPDLVVMSSVYVQLYDPDRLSREVGAPVVVIDYGGAGYVQVDSLKKALIILGSALNREERALELCTFIDSIIRDLDARTKNVSYRPSVYVGAVSYKGAQPFTSSQVRFPPLVFLNTQSIVDDLQSNAGYVSVDFEYILSMQPEYIFVDINNLEVVKDEFHRDKAKFCTLTAFMGQKVHSILPFNYYHTNIATALADAYFMGKVLYPHEFEDVDPVMKANEIFKVFLGKEIYQLFIDGYGLGFTDLSNIFTC